MIVACTAFFFFIGFLTGVIAHFANARAKCGFNLKKIHEVGAALFACRMGHDMFDYDGVIGATARALYGVYTCWPAFSAERITSHAHWSYFLW